MLVVRIDHRQNHSSSYSDIIVDSLNRFTLLGTRFSLRSCVAAQFLHLAKKGRDSEGPRRETPVTTSPWSPPKTSKGHNCHGLGHG